MTFIPSPLPIFVENVAALATSRARTADGGIISTAGYESSGDNGGSSFVYRRQGRDSITLDAFFRTGPGVDDYWEEISKDSVNLRKVGCKGNGSTDDTSAFTDAVLLACDRGVPLLIPRGSYKLTTLSASIAIANDLTILGEGYQSLIYGTDALDFAKHLFHIAANSGARVLCRECSFDTFYRIFEFPTNAGHDPYKIDLRNVSCNNTGAGLIGCPGGNTYSAESVRVQDCEITNSGLDLTGARSWAIDIDLVTCPSTIVTGNSIDTVGSSSNVYAVCGVWINATNNIGNPLQSVIVSNNIIRDVKSGTNNSTDQVVGIIVLEAHTVVSGNVIDTVEAPNHPSSPEGIYTKSKYAAITGNTIIDCEGAEGVINMKGNGAGGLDSGRNVCSNNVISFSVLPNTTDRQSAGINLAAPYILCSGNVIEGTNRGIVAIYAGTTIVNNTIRSVRNTGIVYLPVGTEYDCIIKDNIFDDVGAGDITGTSRGISISFTDGHSTGLLEIVNNTFTNFQQATKIAISGVMNGTTHAKTTIIRRNTFNGMTDPVVFPTTDNQEMTYVEFSDNAIYGATTVFRSTATNKQLRKLGNTLNGKLWEENESYDPYDPLQFEGCVSWWKMTGSSMLTTVGPNVIATEGQKIARILDRSGEGNHLNVFGGGQPAVLWKAAAHSLPSNSARIVASDMAATVPASCDTSNTLFLVFKIDGDTNYRWFYQHTAAPWLASGIRWTFAAEDGNVTDPGKGVDVGSPTFRVNGTVTDFTFQDDVYNATSSGIVIVTVRGLDLSAWDKTAGKLFLGRFPAGLAWVSPGNLFECILYDNALGDEAVASIEQYLAADYEVDLG